MKLINNFFKIIIDQLQYKLHQKNETTSNT